MGRLSTVQERAGRMIRLSEVDAAGYASQLKPYHAFGSPSFAQLNASGVEEVHFLLFSDTRARMGIIGGVRDGVFRSPFSAPFDGFTPADPDVSVATIEESATALEDWAIHKKIKKLVITLPPPIYAESFLAKVVNVFYRRGYSIINTELNFHFDLARLTPEYPSTIWRNARKNLRKAMENDLLFRKCEADGEKELAYGIIRQNRASRQKPLRLTFEQLKQTEAIIAIDYFLVADTTPQPVGAAIVYHVADKLGLVVYWGDLPEHSALRTMNFLSFKVFEYYHNAGFHVLDIGYSTEDSVPNVGLCEFKESLGCNLQPKLSYAKRLDSLNEAERPK